MMVDERETTNGRGFALNCSMEPTSNGKGGLFVDGSSGGVSFSEGTSAEGLIMYKRRKRRKMSNSDEKTKCEFDDKIKTGDGSASHQDVRKLSFDASSIGPSECSLRSCRKIVLQQMYQLLGGREDGLGECIQIALATLSESGCTSEVKESLDSIRRSDNHTHNIAKELSHAMCSGLLNQSESSTISGSCGRGFFEILISDKFSELCSLLLMNVGVNNVDRLLDVNAINTRMKSGAYETSPILYLKDIQQVWSKLQQVGNEMVTLAKSLSDKSRAHYEQFVRKPMSTDACGASYCNGCGEKADVGNCLVCDSCERMYHVSCSELVGTEIPLKSWYCASCVSNGIGSPHDNCVVCEKLKTCVPIYMVAGAPTSEELEDVANGLTTDVHEATDGGQGSKICFICKSEVRAEDHFRTCGHSLCAHKFYHYRCLTSRELGVCGPCWYCPSCLCRRCLVDKDDDQIVLCDGCDQAYHIYCTSPQLNSIPKGSWFCAKCDRNIKRLRTMKMVYENMQKKVKVEENGLEKEAALVATPMVDEHQDTDKSGGLDMLVTAAKTLCHQETMGNFMNTR